MSNRFSTVRSRTAEWGTISAGFALLVAVLLLPLGLFVSSVFVTAVPIVIGIAGGSYLLTQRYGSDDLAGERWRFDGETGHVVRMLSLVGFAGLIATATITGGRTVPFFAVTTLVSALVFGQILFSQRHALRPRWVLVQLIGLAIVVRWVALVSMPGLIGVDAWVHITDYASAIQATRDLAAIADTKYYSAPLYHLLVVVGSMAFDSTLRTALYASLGIVMPLVLLLVYYTTRLFLPIRWALFATAAYSIADHVVRWGIHIIPTSMGLVFFIAVCYGVGRIHTARRSLPLYALVLLVGVATVLTHQVSTFILLVFLGAGAFAQVFVRMFDGEDDHHVNFLGLLVVLGPLAVLDWSIAPVSGVSFLDGMLGLAQRRIATADFLRLASATTVDTTPIESVLTRIPLWVQVVDTLGFLLLLLVALLGSFALLQRRHLELLSLSWVKATAVMLGITLGLPLVGVYVLLPNRWYAFMYLPMVVLGAYGVRYLDLRVSTRHLTAVLAAFVLLFAAPMLVNEHATRDDPVFEQYHTQYAYSEAELDAARTFGAIHPDTVTLNGDHPYRLLLRDWQRLDTEPFQLTAGGTTTGEYVVYRRQLVDSSTLAEFRGESVRVQLARDAVCRPAMDILYTNGKVVYCRGGEPTDGNR